MTQATTLPEPKRRRVPPKVKAAIEALVSGKARNLTQAAKVAGAAREYISRSLTEAHCAAYLRDRAAKQVAIGAGRASARIVSLLDAKSEHVSFDASKHVLAVAGIKPPSDAASVNLDMTFRAGIVIDLTEPGQERVVDIAAAGGVITSKVIDGEPAEPSAPLVTSHRGEA
jgi:hypothetical protein